MQAFEITWENQAGSLTSATISAHTSVEAIWEFALSLGWTKARYGENPHPGAKYVSCQEVGTFAAPQAADGALPAERREAGALLGSGNHPDGAQYGPADMTRYDQHRADG